MKTYSYGLAVLLLLVAAFEVNDARADHLATFGDLLDGGAIIDGDFTYSNFQLTSDFGTVSPNFDEINVAGIGSGLEFSSKNEFFLFPGDDSLVVQFEYDVSATDPGVPLSNASGTSSFDPDFTFITGDGLADLFVNFETQSGALLANTNAIVDPSFGIERLSDSQNFGSVENDLRIQANLSLFADSDALVAFRSFQITTSAVPEPNSAVVIVLSLATVVSRRRR